MLIGSRLVFNENIKARSNLWKQATGIVECLILALKLWLDEFCLYGSKAGVVFRGTGESPALQKCIIIF